MAVECSESNVLLNFECSVQFCSYTRWFPLELLPVMSKNLDVVLNSSAATEFIYLALVMSCSQGSPEPSTKGLDIDSDVPIKVVRK